MRIESWLPLVDLKDYGTKALGKDLAAAASVTFLSIPQGVAYAIIAGLPPAMGLYACCVPTIVGALFRSSRHVVAGPSNALSLLVGTVGAAALAQAREGTSLTEIVLTISLIVGVMQVLAGFLRLGALVDFVSMPVVTGYITGAGVLIGIGQLPNLTGSPGQRGNLYDQVSVWIHHLDETRWLAVVIGVATAALILGLRAFPRTRGWPGPMIALALATAVSWIFDFGSMGVSTIAEGGQGIAAGLPPFRVPPIEGAPQLLVVAIPVAVLSLIESSAVARALASKSGQRLELSSEFVGQGLSNVAAAFTMGYPVSGSLSRSAINYQAGAATRLAGAFSGAILIVVLLFFGPVANYTPHAALAGLLFIVAADLVDWRRIKRILTSRRADAATFAVTVLGTWALRLDHAIYLGVGLSALLFLRRSRMLAIHDIVVDDQNRPLEVPLGDADIKTMGTAPIRMVQLEGQLFFGAAGQLAGALDEILANGELRVLILRVRRAHGLDLTALTVLEAASQRMRLENRHLIITGADNEVMNLLRRTGAIAVIGQDHIFPTTLTWFQSMNRSLKLALDLLTDEEREKARRFAAFLESDRSGTEADQSCN